MKKALTPWVVAGGKSGEAAYCQRCGAGLQTGSQPIYLWIAMTNAFVKHHANCADSGRVEPSPQSAFEWFKGRDTGISSLTIYRVFAHTETPLSCYDVPHDPADFGRCYRLLKLMPSWRERIGEVAGMFPTWKPLTDAWEELTSMYEEELPNGTAPRLYARMRQLRESPSNGGDAPKETK